MGRPLRNAPTWKPMWIAWWTGIPLMLIIDLAARTPWGGLAMIPYAALAAQTFTYGTKNDS